MNSYDRELKDLGIAKIFEVVGSRPRIEFGIKCKDCGFDGRRYYPRQPPPEQIAQQFRQQGWSLKDKVAICSVCIGKKTEKIKKEKELMSSTSNAKQIAAVAMELAKQYDEKAGRYKQGYTDETVARIALVAPPFVGKVREELYGPMKENPEITQLRQDIEAWINMGREMQSRLAKLSAPGNG